MGTFWRIAAAAAAYCVLFPAPALARPEGGAIEKGRALIVEKCARCHAIGESDVSPHEKAPPFRSIAARYPVENLAEALAEGIVSGHPDMPVFVFEPPEIEAILAYLDSLNAPPEEKK